MRGLHLGLSVQLVGDFERRFYAVKLPYFWDYGNGDTDQRAERQSQYRL
jgi:hypothetical protein